MDASLLANLGAYTAQVACVAALGTLVAALVRVDAAAVRYGFWRLLLAACLVLPFVQGRRDPAPLGTAGGVETAAALPDVTMAVIGAAAPAPAGIDWLFIAGVVLAAGVGVRLLWLGASLISLRRMRALGIAGGSAISDDMQRTLGTRAEIRYVDGLRQPVTFGVVRPVVLLPRTLREHPEEIQRAVLCHELLHVQRRDWLWVLGEEAVRAVLWFNPAVWWLIARVQLAREEVVDELAVLATNRRKAYMEALLAFADETPLAPAAAFARRRHLFRRMVLLSREGVMSSRRIVLSFVVMLAVMLAGSWYAVSAFPLVGGWQAVQLGTEPGPLEKQAKRITEENPVPRRVNHAAADYPAAAEVVGMTGAVTFRITLDAVGRVAEARTQSVSFRASSGSSSASFHAVSPLDIDRFLKGYQERNPGIIGLREGVHAMVQAAFDALRQWRYDPPFDAPISFPVTIPVGAQPTPAPTVTGRSTTPLAGAEGALRVGGNIKAPTKIRDVRPVYPDIAMNARVQGVVIIEALIGPDGAVQDAKVLRSIPLLDDAAVEAVMQWRFVPTLLNGVPVPVIMTVTVNFTLQ